MRRISLVLIVVWLLAACVALPAPATEQGSAQAIPTTPAIEFTPLAFAGNGDTFLTHIGDAIAEHGDPEEHRFVEVAGVGTDRRRQNRAGELDRA